MFMPLNSQFCLFSFWAGEKGGRPTGHNLGHGIERTFWGLQLSGKWPYLHWALYIRSQSTKAD